MHHGVIDNEVASAIDTKTLKIQSRFLLYMKLHLFNKPHLQNRAYSSDIKPHFLPIIEDSSHMYFKGLLIYKVVMAIYYLSPVAM
jgi:hypothetical protein